MAVVDHGGRAGSGQGRAGSWADTWKNKSSWEFKESPGKAGKDWEGLTSSRPCLRSVPESTAKLAAFSHGNYPKKQKRRRKGEK